MEPDANLPVAEQAANTAEPDEWDPLALARWLELGIMPSQATDADARLSVQELFGRGILRLRLYRMWSQRDLEAESGVDQSTICRLETGRRANVGSRRLCAILKALMVGDVVFLPRKPPSPPTALDVMLHGDPWQGAVDEAERRVNRRRNA
jgi:transcriptional regulator with XRE-family HTH domain